MTLPTLIIISFILPEPNFLPKSNCEGSQGDFG